MKSFVKYVEYRRLLEMEEEQPMGLGDLAGPKEFGQDPMTRGSSESKEAFEDLQSSIGVAVAGPSGKKILTAMVSAILNDPQVEDRIKTEIKGKIKSRWSSLIDLSGVMDMEKGLNSSADDSKRLSMGMDNKSSDFKSSAAEVGF